MNKMPTVPKGYISRSQKPSRAAVTLPDVGDMHPTQAGMTALEKQLETTRHEKLMLEDALQAALRDVQRYKLKAGAA